MSTAALYARVSTRDKQETENQLMQLREFAHKQGWKTLEYIDRVTGKHSDRERFQQLFQDASRRKFDAVLFWSWDRFSREGVRETLNHLNLLDSYGVAYKSDTEQYIDSLRHLPRRGNQHPGDDTGRARVWGGLAIPSALNPREIIK